MYVFLDAYQQSIPQVFLPPYVARTSTSTNTRTRTRILDETTSPKFYALRTPELRMAPRLPQRSFPVLVRHWLHSSVRAHGSGRNLQINRSISVLGIKSESVWGNVLVTCPVSQA